MTEGTGTDVTEGTELFFSVTSLLCMIPLPLFPTRVACGAIVAALALTSCGRTPAATPPASNAAPADTASPAAGSLVPHGDHNPHHGGVVMMKGDDLHYEIVLDPAGRAHRVYFTDAVRDELPASVASEVVLTIKRLSAPDERIAMQIDDAGESWVGRGVSVANPATTTARLAFSIKNEPYWIDIPFKTGDPR
jgi:hypothetical protein